MVLVVGEVLVGGGGGIVGVVGLMNLGKVNFNIVDEIMFEMFLWVGLVMVVCIFVWWVVNGCFIVIEDLMSVLGIGEKIFDGLKDLVMM